MKTLLKDSVGIQEKKLFIVAPRQTDHPGRAGVTTYQQLILSRHG